MSIEVQKAPIVSQIVLDHSNNDLHYSLDDNGVITNSTSTKKQPSKFTKTNDFAEDTYGTMADKYSDGYDSYDDDFEDDSPVRNGSRTRTRQRKPSLLSEDRSNYSYSPTPPSTKRNTKNNSTYPRRNSLVSYRSAYGQSRATNKPKKTKKSLSASTRPPKTDDNSTMVKKILSANRNKITKLYNVVEELQQEVEHLRQENKTLKRITVKQERELKRVDREEGSLPQLLQRHSAELRTVRERLKKNKQEISRKEKESHGHDVELTKLRDKVHHYKELDNNKKLEERAALSKKLEKVEISLSEKDTKILELQKTIKLSEKARQREIKEQQDRYKKAKEELGKVQENVVSLREKLKEKEKQLDMTNIYHLNMQRKMKKVNPLALPSTHEEEIHTKNDFANSSLTEKKRVNIFLTNAVSDTSSNATADAAKIEHKSEVVVNERKNKNSFSEVDESLEFKKKQAARLKEVFEREERRRTEEETRREEEKRREEDRQRKEEEELREKKRQLEEDKRRKEEQEKIENERRKREEEERIRKEKDEQARLKFKEDDEARRKKDLLLARMKAIDSTQGKPNGIIDIDLNTKNIDEKPKKLPIFLQSAAKESVTTNNKVTSDTEKQKFGSSNSVRSKHSKESSYDVKESFENLYQGLPAHPTDQHFRGRRNSQDDEPSFGSYKPTVTRRAEGSKKTEPTFGAYNPSFGDSRKDSGLDFGKKQDKKDKSKDVIFGSYEPTFGNAKTSKTITEDNDTPLDFSSKKSDGRRPRANQPNTVFGDDLFSNKSKRSSIINDDPFGSSNTSKDKNYPWEKKVNVATNKDSDSLLPRRSKLNQVPKQSVPAVGNMLNGTFDDDLEEVTL